MSADSLVRGFEFLAATPLLWLSLTLAAYLAATVVNERCYRMPLLNPTLLAIALVVVVLTRSDGIIGRHTLILFADLGSPKPSFAVSGGM